MLLTLLYNTPLMLQTSAVDNTASLVSSALTNGGVGAVLLVIWFITVKYLTSNNQKNYDAALKQNQEQFQFALKQNQDQFEKALCKIETQHKDFLTMNEKTIDKLFIIMQKDGEYKEILTGVLEQMKESLTNHIEEHKR